MPYENRAYSIRTVETAEELVKLLSEMSWCLCNGFRLDGVLYLNDAFSEDGAQEYAVIAVESEDASAITGTQFESITVSWMTPEELLAAVVAYGDPTERERLRTDGMNVPARVRLHGEGSCRFCQ